MRVCRTLIGLLLFAWLPAAAEAVPPPPGVICITITDAATGNAFPLTLVEVFDWNRRPVIGTAFPSPVDRWCSDILAAGSYRVRVRAADATGERMIRYEWYGRASTYEEATPVVLDGSGGVELDFRVGRMHGAAVSGIVSDATTGTPIPGNDCYWVELYEEGGVPMGVRHQVGATGAWSSSGRVPAGTYYALAHNFGPDPYLDRWHGGPSGAWGKDYNCPVELFPWSDTLPAPGLLATATPVVVLPGVAATGINFPLLAVPTCRGRAPTIIGTTLNDSLLGTPGPDVIVGLAGSDTIRGLAGNDYLCGNAGGDVLIGGAGRDTAAGGAGTDVCTVESAIDCEVLP